MPSVTSSALQLGCSKSGCRVLPDLGMAIMSRKVTATSSSSGSALATSVQRKPGSTLQSLSQPSPERVLPSSQASLSDESLMPSPQDDLHDAPEQSGSTS